MNEIQTIDPKEYGLDDDKAAEVEKAFLPVIAEGESLSANYTEIVNQPISQALTQQARELRLKLVKVRTNTEKIHKVSKAFYLAGGRFVDALKNRNVTVIEQMESRLSEIENHYINLENERKQKLGQERYEQLSAYGMAYGPELLINMTEESFQVLLDTAKVAKQAREEAAQKAENERLAAIKAEQDRQAAIEAENAKLKAEAAERERVAQIEREKQAKIAAEEKAKNDKIIAEQRAKAEAEANARKEAEKRLAEIEAQKQAEAKAKASAERKARRAPDKLKVAALVDTLNDIVYPACNDHEAQEIIDYAQKGIENIIEFLNTSFEAMD